MLHCARLVRACVLIVPLDREGPVWAAACLRLRESCRLTSLISPTERLMLRVFLTSCSAHLVLRRAAGREIAAITYLRPLGMAAVLYLACAEARRRCSVCWAGLALAVPLASSTRSSALQGECP